MTKKTNSPSKEEIVEKINSIRVIAHWKGFSPDCRPYKPSTPEISFGDIGIKIIVDVPLTKNLIDNADVISMAQLSNQNAPDPIFTPLGMRYIIDQFESAMSNQKDELEVSVADDDDWGDEETTDEFKTDKSLKKSAKSDDWDDEAETDQPGVEKPEENFDEDWS